MHTSLLHCVLPLSFPTSSTYTGFTMMEERDMARRALQDEKAERAEEAPEREIGAEEQAREAAEKHVRLKEKNRRPKKD